MSGIAALVIGGNRGIGLGLVEHLLKRPEVDLVFATYRDERTAKELFHNKDSRLVPICMNVDSDESIHKAFNEVKMNLLSRRLDMLINNAAILLPYSIDDKPDRSLLNRQMETNVVSITIISQVFLPLLRLDSQSNFPARIVNISGWLGSIKLNDSGSKPFQLFAYRMTKAALNMLTKTLAVDLKDEGIIAASICPGWVKTDMGTQDATLSVNESTSAVITTAFALTQEQSGGFFDRFLKPIEY